MVQDAAHEVSEEYRLIVSPLVAGVGDWREDAALARAIARDAVPL
jgi:hypothetical protein